ncbi:PilN domain-containing protein [Enterobacter asburiae]|uniref:PilN domain-containing protein n=1 Tax=Enterobacter asburiae TaxID=61645 RepID=UPI002A82668B|nr:PilN domain-containing protein [Enterobacter asburiae]
MSIMNFLPWRQQRRARCLRFWGAMCVGTVLLMFAIIFCLRINPVMRLHALQTELTGTQTVQHALASREKLASQAQKPAQTRQQRAWQPVLESLSRATPSQVWLTERRYQPPALMLTGYAITLPALSALRDALGQIAGFTPGTAGELRQDSQGRWMFTLHLKSEG